MSERKVTWDKKTSSVIAETSHPLNGIGIERVEFRIPSGGVKIQGIEGANFSLTQRLTFTANSEAVALEHLEGFKDPSKISIDDKNVAVAGGEPVIEGMSVTAPGDLIGVVISLGSNRINIDGFDITSVNSSEPKLEWELSLPMGYRARYLVSTGGGVAIARLAGVFDVRGEPDRVDVDRFSGQVRIETRQGNVMVVNTTFEEDSSIHTRSGRIGVNTSNSDLRIIAESRSGDIQKVPGSTMVIDSEGRLDLGQNSRVIAGGNIINSVIIVGGSSQNSGRKITGHFGIPDLSTTSLALSSRSGDIFIA